MFVKTIFLIFLTLFSSSVALSEEIRKEVIVITVDGVINPVSAEYIGKSIKKANEKKAEALIIARDAPGGLDTSMRIIVKDIIGSEVPVVVYVSPSGSRAASAGVFITLAAHIAAMAPGTNIGAAHPVGIGEKMDKAMGEKGLSTKNAAVVREEVGFRHRILNLISDPNIAYMLMLLGFYGLFFELTNPGAIFPGVLGGISLILAFYAFQTLPVNYPGLLLIILAIILFILEVKIISHGVLTIGGVIAMFIGSLMLFESPAPFMKLSLAIVLPAVLITTLFFSLTFGLAYKAYKRKPVTGSEGLTGAQGVAYTEITKDGGMVLLHGERWSAYSVEPIAKGEKLIVEAVSDLKVKVKKLQ